MSEHTVDETIAQINAGLVEARATSAAERVLANVRASADLTRLGFCTPCGDARVSASKVIVMTDGCQAFPDDRVQGLCAQHAHSIDPIGGAYWIIPFKFDEWLAERDAKVRAEAVRAAIDTLPHEENCIVLYGSGDVACDCRKWEIRLALLGDSDAPTTEGRCQCRCGCQKASSSPLCSVCMVKEGRGYDEHGPTPEEADD